MTLTRARPAPKSAAFREQRRHRLMLPAILIGLLTGSLSVGFHLCIDAGEVLRGHLIGLAHAGTLWGIFALWLYVISALVLSAEIVRWLAPETAGSGIPHLKAILQEQQPFRYWRVLPVKFISTLIGSAGGLVLGREGPSVHMGSAIGQAVADRFSHWKPADRAILAAAGGGAGLAAAFNAPLSGLVFVLEELERQCASLEFFAAAIACLAADMLCRLILGQHPEFHVVVSGAPPLDLLIAFVPVGILSALFGSLFTRALLWGQRLPQLSLGSKLVFWFFLAAVITLTGWVKPDLLGGGQNFVNRVLQDGETFTLPTIALFFLIRFVLTLGSASAGSAGGFFMPILVVGALLGWGLGEATHMLFPALLVNTKLFAVVGMAGFFSAVVKAPLTGIILIIEMTANYALILPLLIACFAALLIADWLGSPPIYDALLRLSLLNNEKS
ncbi:H(+)/Cl(-) exchange transporter ClcA [Methylomonas sp.]|uniref:H(+)/Cl(-) exchange transporter ClcA n=1 Tax=Methylomonas sp. TaxID=418 RepID=UPI0025F77D0B|nr:H(+)/Cl(-) exchange transporter ClcA [Methylomonas sp.]